MSINPGCNVTPTHQSMLHAYVLTFTRERANGRQCVAVARLVSITHLCNLQDHYISADLSHLRLNFIWFLWFCTYSEPGLASFAEIKGGD
jgi:hypothetical protein